MTEKIRFSRKINCPRKEPREAKNVSPLTPPITCVLSHCQSSTQKWAIPGSFVSATSPSTSQSLWHWIHVISLIRTRRMLLILVQRMHPRQFCYPQPSHSHPMGTQNTALWVSLPGPSQFDLYTVPMGNIRLEDDGTLSRRPSQPILKWDRLVDITAARCLIIDWNVSQIATPRTSSAMTTSTNGRMSIRNGRLFSRSWIPPRLSAVPLPTWIHYPLRRCSRGWSIILRFGLSAEGVGESKTCKKVASPSFPQISAPCCEYQDTKFSPGRGNSTLPLNGSFLWQTAVIFRQWYSQWKKRY